MCEVPNYRIEKDERLGRYLVANKPLKKGTLIFTDVPFALGPKPGKFYFYFIHSYCVLRCLSYVHLFRIYL